jgi:hypothetical protein
MMARENAAKLLSELGRLSNLMMFRFNIWETLNLIQACMRWETLIKVKTAESFCMNHEPETANINVNECHYLIVRGKGRFMKDVSRLRSQTENEDLFSPRLLNSRYQNP